MAVALRQFGVIRRDQLLAVGISSARIQRWAQDGRLTRLYPGVFSLGHAMLVPDGRRLAAVFACGPTAWMDGHDAGAVLELCRSRGSRFSVVVEPGRARRGQRAGIHVHESFLTPDDVVVVRGIPVTSVARTIVDIAARTPDQAEDVIDAAIAMGVFDVTAMERQLLTGRRGVAVVRAALAERHPDSHRTKSQWEAAMLRLIRTHSLPRPQVNPDLQDMGLAPDLLWPASDLVVEWDSWAFHRTRTGFESDRRKTIRLQTAGYTVLRFTWRQTQDEPETVAQAIRAALDRAVPRVR